MTNGAHPPKTTDRPTLIDRLRKRANLIVPFWLRSDRVISREDTYSRAQRAARTS